MTVNIVVAKYNENVEWTKNIKNHKLTIYDKSDNPVDGSIPLENVGREGETFLHHIVTNYDNLDDVTVFLHGNPFEHVCLLVGWRSVLTSEEIDEVVHKMNTEIDSSTPFTTFYQVLYNDPNGTNNVNSALDCIEYYDEYHSFFTVCPGAQYIVPKEKILSRPFAFWKRLHDAMHSEILNGYCQEQMWYLAYMHSMNTKVGNHDAEKARCLNSHPSMKNTPTSYFKGII